MNNLANLYADQGRYGEAEGLLVKALEGLRRALGPEHAHTLNTMNNLGALYYNQKRYGEAEAIFRETAEHDRRVRGEKHPSTLQTEYNLACVLALGGKPKEALAILHQIVDQGFDEAPIAEDPDLGSLHGEPGFSALVAEIEKRKKPQ
jgi:tetratricopeptide (TPR) repeat protein